MTDAVTVYTVRDERGHVATTTDHDRAARLSRAGLRVTARTGGVGG
jgi:hypothetical protein